LIYTQLEKLVAGDPLDNAVMVGTSHTD